MAEPATLKRVSEVLRIEGETLSQFSREWQALGDVDKQQLRQGIGDGSMTY